MEGVAAANKYMDKKRGLNLDAVPL
jgi:hypothetical protein